MAVEELYISTGKKVYARNIEAGKPLTEYLLSFNPKKKVLLVLYFLNFLEGKLKSQLSLLFDNHRQTTSLKLTTTYSIDRRLYFYSIFLC
jgi:hypothetical protein